MTMRETAIHKHTGTKLQKTNLQHDLLCFTMSKRLGGLFNSELFNPNYSTETICKNLTPDHSSILGVE